MSKSVGRHVRRPSDSVMVWGVSVPITPERKSRALAGGSPWYQESCGAVAASSSTYFDLENHFGSGALKKFEPVDSIEVVNEDSVTVRIHLDNRFSFLVPSNTIRANSDIPFRTVRLENTDASTAVTSGKIDVMVRKGPMTADLESRYAAGFGRFDS